jgi:hypothetical protein
MSHPFPRGHHGRRYVSSDAEGWALIRESWADRNRALNAISVAKRRGPGKNLKWLIRQYLISDTAKIAILAYLRGHQSESGSMALVKDARAISMNEPENETVHVKCVPKKNSGSRTVLVFPEAAKVRQRIMKDVLGVASRCASYQYGTHQGVRKARDAVANAMRSGNYRYAVVADISDFFGSINPGAAVEKLPIPKEMARRVLLTSSYRYESGERPTEAFIPLLADDTTSASSKRIGIPQGSAASSHLAEQLIADLRNRIEVDLEGDAFTSYLDDFNILAVSEEEARRRKRALEDALLAHPAGPFRLRGPSTGYKGIHSLEDGFRFLGVNFRLEDGLVFREPPREWEENVLIELRFDLESAYLLNNELIGEDAPMKFDGDYPKNIADRIRGYKAAYGDCGSFMCALRGLRYFARECAQIRVHGRLLEGTPEWNSYNARQAARRSPLDD